MPASEIFNEIFVNQRTGSSLYKEAKTRTPVQGEHGEITYFVSSGKEITEQMRTDENLHFVEDHDAVAVLSNKVSFIDEIPQALARAHRHDRLIAVMFPDLGGLKSVEDSMAMISATISSARSAGDSPRRCARVTALSPVS